MIDPNISQDEVIERQKKIIDALMARAEQGEELKGSHFAVFQSAIALQRQVRSKTEHLEDALRALGSTSDELKSAYSDQERMRINLLAALEVMEEGFALFTEGKLVICNDHFRRLFPEITPHCEPGLPFRSYLEAIISTKNLAHALSGKEREEWLQLDQKLRAQTFASMVLPFKEDRWTQMSFRRTSYGNVAVLQTDISKIVEQNRREKDQLIDRQARYLQSTFEHLQTGIAAFSPNWQLMHFNQRFADLLQLPVSLQTSGTSIARLFKFFDPQSLSPATLYQDDPMRWIEFMSEETRIIERLDGVIIEASFNEIPDEGYIVNLRDVTLEAQARKALTQTNEELEKHVRARTKELNLANRELLQAKETAERANISKTRFLAAASHDLLQPVNASKLYISMLKERALEEEGKDYVKRLDRAFQNMEALLHDLLDISHLESQTTKFNLAKFSLREFLESAAENLEEFARAKEISITVKCPDIFIESDRHYLGRVLQNLVSNAIQYTPQGGRVLVAGRARGDMVNIEVYDTGVGIAKKDFRLIFNEFTRLQKTQNSTPGMGLGLSIVEHACRQLGHPVSVHSHLGRGSMFRVGVPRAEVSKSKIPSRPKRNAQKQTLFDRLIFLIENDNDVLHATSRLLENWGAGVIAVRSQQEALEQFEELGEIPDLVIVDYELDDDMTGIEAILAMREKCGDALPAIMITANHSEALEKSSEMHNFTLMKKPINLTALRKQVANKAEKSETILAT